MIDHLLHDYQHWLLMIWVGGLLVAAVLALGYFAFWYKYRHAEKEAIISQLFSISDLNDSLEPKQKSQRAGNSVDTLFILPDISNYTSFVMGTQSNADQAQEIIFALMSAIIKTAGETLHFSKMEGDSALFFADADKVSPRNVGETVSSIFDAFDRQKESFYSELRDDPIAQTLIKKLDLKIIVHRGLAQRFAYRGTIDHFGSEVTALHKLLKNRISAKRYVLVTDAASANVQLDADLWGNGSFGEFLEAGSIKGQVFTNTTPSITPSDPKYRSPNHQKRISKMKLKTIISAMLIATVSTVAFATEFTKGTIKKIDTKSGKITVKHEELKNLEMPAMTMVFVAKDDAMLGKLKEGENIEFIAELVKGKLTLIEVK